MLYHPGVTYRVQLNKDFTLKDLHTITRYLGQLGVKTIYASPILTAVPGSTHGYDVTDATQINPEIGNEKQFEEIAQLLQQYEMGWLQDIVPNHMAYHTQNKWLMDVLEHGETSAYANYFDIDWRLNNGQLMLPVLDKTLAEAVENGDVTLTIQDDKPYLKVNGDLYSVDTVTWTDKQANASNDKQTLLQLAEAQHYLLCPWQETDKQINYRRFFTINGMICLNIQDERVFEDYHSYIKTLLERGFIQGLRIDHIDGLYDPTTYLHRLRKMAGKETYIIVEKILEPGENLPAYWPVQGTTGYDFIALVNNLFTLPESEQKLTTFYKRISGNERKLEDELREKKAFILSAHMQGELNNLLEMLLDIVGSTQANIEDLKEVLSNFLVFCPVYRFYSNRFPLDVAEQKELHKTFARIDISHPEMANTNTVLQHLLLEPNLEQPEANKKIARFFMRCMQFTGPLMAKGMEDTLMYTYNRFLAINEVGDSPTLSANTAEEFHKAILKRAAAWPDTMNATATHDTKRGEDARARLHVLTDIAEKWIKAAERWFVTNHDIKINGAPDRNDEYFIYQAIMASYPMPGEPTDDFEERFTAYIEKALREGKVHTDWANPETSYEAATTHFIQQILKADSLFLQDFKALHKKVADAGIINALVQLTLKCTCPGVPDIYRGTELWDLSMVDPDNRRPVDFDIRATRMMELANDADREMMTRLWAERYNGKIKLWLLQTLLRLRNEYKDVFEKGDYIPLHVTGRYANNVIAYARCYHDEWVVTVLPLHTAAMADDADWGDTAVLLRQDVPVVLTDCLSHFTNKGDQIRIADITGVLPMAIMQGNRKPQTREAGILLPVFSLQSDFGIGDFGRGAYDFADFLQSAHQRYWQLLPLNPTDAGAMYSPYSSASSMACNPLLISPQILAEERLLDSNNLSMHTASNTGMVNYGYAEQLKAQILDEAYSNFITGTYLELSYAYAAFCEEQAYWLNDYALYEALKTQYNQEAWYSWPEEYKNRNSTALEEFARERAEIIDKTKWIQFIAARQWSKLKQYCNARNVKLFGDLPFYISHDSVDVWANPGYFTLDEHGGVNGIAGVPPDYFSEDGQLWGVPTFNWDKLKADNYDWWVKRLKKNTELFDVVRIDHFRALAAYWEVAAGATNARTGKWLQGPGMDFFKVLEEQLGNLPFIAEDLGYEMEDVYALREQSTLPGMKVLQFAWGDNIAVNVDIPHNHSVNCIAYTGTHDNNTTLGWYRNETSEADRARMQAYTGRHITEENAHKEMAAIVYGSVARIAILPMQDVIGLDEKARMNTPGTTTNNWQWRLPEGALSKLHSDYLKDLTALYGRK